MGAGYSDNETQLFFGNGVKKDSILCLGREDFEGFVVAFEIPP
jgi:hypothetical protein